MDNTLQAPQHRISSSGALLHLYLKCFLHSPREETVFSHGCRGHKLKYQSVLLSNKRLDDWLQPGDVLKVIYHKYLEIPNISSARTCIYINIQVFCFSSSPVPVHCQATQNVFNLSWTNVLKSREEITVGPAKHSLIKCYYWSIEAKQRIKLTLRSFLFLR